MIRKIASVPLCMYVYLRFAQKDSDETILFDDPEGEKSITGPGPLIKAGTIHKLVERLTYHEYAGKQFFLCITEA